MIKVFNIIAALLILTVTAVGNQGYYLCNSENIIHLIQSCCAERQAEQGEEECCCSEPKEDNNISEVCCSKVDFAVDQWNITQSEDNSDEQPEFIYSNMIFNYSTVKSYFKYTGVPPPDLPSSNNLKIYITLCSFLY